MISMKISFFMKAVLVLLFGRQMTLSLVIEKHDGPIVNTASGSIKGIRMKTENYRPIYGFLGIPFIKPPIGNLRFKRPEPIEPWEGILNATWEGNLCPQDDFVWISITNDHFYLGNEDCVQLNIFVPKTTKSKLPVMIVFPGGAFKEIGASMFFVGPGKLLEKDIILVSINYRIGVLGFLSTADDASPGNFGLLDQVEGMRWIKNNIESFGGDPNEITLCGFSAGGMSVNLHLVSPLTKGLFKRVIMQSGTVFMPNFMNYHQLSRARKFAAILDCPINDNYELVECLRQKPASLLTITANTMKIENESSEMPRFLPVVDNYYLHDIPHNLFFKGEYQKVPMLLGALKHDGYYFFYRLMKYEPQLQETDIDKIFRLFTTRANQFDYVPLDLKYIIKKEYFDGVNMADRKAIIQNFSELVTDLLFKAPIVHLLTYVLNTTSAPVYLYCFEERAPFGIMDVTDTKNSSVVSHTDELRYLFTGVYSTIKMPPSSEQLSRNMVKMWYNFVLHGNPTPKGDPVLWNAIKTENMEYLRIAKDMNMEKRFRTRKMDLFIDIYVELKRRYPNQSTLIRGMTTEINETETNELSISELLESAKPIAGFVEYAKEIGHQFKIIRISAEKKFQKQKIIDPTLFVALALVLIFIFKSLSGKRCYRPKRVNRH